MREDRSSYRRRVSSTEDWLNAYISPPYDIATQGPTFTYDASWYLPNMSFLNVPLAMTPSA